MKNSSNYLAKILILTIITAILGKVYNDKKYINSNYGIKINSWKFSNIINKEIAVFNNTSNANKKNYSNSITHKSTYIEQIISGELDMIKIANLQDLNYLNINAENENLADNLTEGSNKANEDLTENKNTNQEIIQTNTDNITEPGIRTKHRSISFKCAR